MIPDRARIPVLTLPCRHRHMLTAGLAQASICRAFVVIIAKVDVLPFHCAGLVNLAIAIVVQSIAYLGCRHQSIATRQAGFRADPHPRTEAGFVGHLAGRPQPEFNGLFCAGADSRIGHALRRLNAVDSGRA